MALLVYQVWIPSLNTLGPFVSGFDCMYVRYVLVPVIIHGRAV
jgi:hypothetical protein